VALVPQDPTLLSGTIAENIRYGRPNAATTEMLTASRQADCDRFIRQLPNGYQTLVGERGQLLSAGQRQRIALARAILTDPRILILDEPTSHLDAESDELIQLALRRLARGRTTVVIAHRLSTVEGADQILVLEGGNVVERGTHEDLARAKGRYREMLSAPTAGIGSRAGALHPERRFA
jgi:ABC-type multidrug transport system fused ATPase/permease subunit